MWWMAVAMAAPLTAGVVVDGDDVFAMTDGGTARIRATGGEEAWRNPSVEAPLEAHGDHVLALGDDSRALVVLSRTDGREVARCAALTLPAWAGPLGQTPTTSVQVRGSWDGDAFVVAWHAGSVAPGGVAVSHTERLVAVGRSRCRVDGTGEALEPTGTEGDWVGTAPPVPAGAPVDPAWTWSGVSYDGAWLAGVVEGSPGVAIWRIDGRPVATLDNAPWGKAFAVVGGRYVTVKVDEAGQAQVIGQAFDRASPLVWRVGVKDLQHRGPFPPGP